MGTIKIKGYAKREVNADMVDIDITFKSEGIKYSDSLSKVNRQCEVFLNEIEKMGINTKDFHLENDKTSTEGYDKNRHKTVLRELSFRIKFNAGLINKILNIIEECKLEAEIKTNYFYSDKENLEKDLLKEAILDSKKKAEALASANNEIVRYAESVSDDKDEFDDQDDCRIHKTGFVGDIVLNEDMYSDKLSGKLLSFSETVYVTWKTE